VAGFGANLDSELVLVEEGGSDELLFPNLIAELFSTKPARES
jgi:hypothetical protein